MIDHLTNDIHTYEQVCLNVRDIQELRLIQLPSTFNESKAKLRAIDPCLVDIRLSSSDEYETRSNGSNNDQPPCAPIARQRRGESFGSTGGDPLITSSSNESSSSSGVYSIENIADESNDESIDEQIEKFSQLTTITNLNSKPVTLLAKKVLPKKIERPSTSIVNTNNNLRPTMDDSTQINDQNTLKKGPMITPVHVTITSKLNPDAAPFYTQQRNLPPVQNSSFTFYERPRFRPRLPPVVSPDRTQSVPYGRNVLNNNQQQQNSYQRFVPLRQMIAKKNITQINSTKTNSRPVRAPPPMAKYRFYSSNALDKRSYPQQQQKRKPSTNVQAPGEFSFIIQ